MRRWRKLRIAIGRLAVGDHPSVSAALQKILHGHSGRAPILHVKRGVGLCLIPLDCDGIDDHVHGVEIQALITAEMILDGGANGA